MMQLCFIFHFNRSEVHYLHIKIGCDLLNAKKQHRKARYSYLPGSAIYFTTRFYPQM